MSVASRLYNLADHRSPETESKQESFQLKYFITCGAGVGLSAARYPMGWDRPESKPFLQAHDIIRCLKRLENSGRHTCTVEAGSGVRLEVMCSLQLDILDSHRYIRHSGAGRHPPALHLAHCNTLCACCFSRCGCRVALAPVRCQDAAASAVLCVTCWRALFRSSER